MSRPVALILLGILGHIDDYGAARSITSQLVDALPAGSYLVIADGVAANPAVSGAQRRYDQSARPRYGVSAPAPYLLRKPDELASFFDGLDLVEPGVVPCSRWRPDGLGAGGSARMAARTARRSPTAAWPGNRDPSGLLTINCRFGPLLRNDSSLTRMGSVCFPVLLTPTLTSWSLGSAA